MRGMGGLARPESSRGAPRAGRRRVRHARGTGRDGEGGRCLRRESGLGPCAAWGARSPGEGPGEFRPAPGQAGIGVAPFRHRGMARCAGKRLPRWQAVSRPAASWNVRARAESDRRRHGAGVCRLVLVAGARFESWWTIVRVAPCPSPDAGSDAGDGPCRGRPSGRSGDGRLNMRLQDLQSWPLCCGGAKATSCQTSGRRRARRPVSASSHRGRGGGIEMAQGGGVRVAVGGGFRRFSCGRHPGGAHHEPRVDPAVPSLRGRDHGRRRALVARCGDGARDRYPGGHERTPRDAHARNGRPGSYRWNSGPCPMVRSAAARNPPGMSTEAASRRGVNWTYYVRRFSMPTIATLPDELMPTLLVSSKGQIVLPAALRRRLGMGAGARLEVIEEPDGLKLRVARPVPPADMRDLAGMVKAPARGVPRNLEDFDAASTLSRSSRRGRS